MNMNMNVNVNAKKKRFWTYSSSRGLFVLIIDKGASISVISNNKRRGPTNKVKVTIH